MLVSSESMANLAKSLRTVYPGRAGGVSPIVFGTFFAHLRVFEVFVTLRLFFVASLMDVSSLQRLRIVARANELFARLRHAGCERDTAGNRRLLYSHYASLVLLSL